MAKSTGQWIGTVVGAVIGAFIPGGYVMLGATLGGMVGGLIDPPKGPKIEGPRINDLNVQTATYGAQIPIIKGTVATFGNIFWVENNQIKETKKTESQGGKGGGGQETTTYSYSATFALGVCLGPVDGIRRIWCSGKLIFDSGANNLSAIMASALAGGVVNLASFAKGATPEAAGGGGITFYNGGPDQQPDPRMQAALGVANTPAYRGLAYLVFEDFQLADFGNTLMGAQFKIEVVETASTEQYSIRTRVQNGLFTSLGDEYVDTGLTTIGPYNPVIENGVMRFDKERTRYSVSLEGVLLARSVAPGIAPGSVGDPGERFYVGTTSGGHAVYYNTTGPGTSGWLVVGGNTQFSGKFDPDYVLQGACVGADGNLYLHTYNGSGSEIEKYDGIDLSLEWSQSAPFAWNTATNAYPYLPGTSVSMAVNEGTLLWFLATAATDLDFVVYSIGADGTLVGLHTFTSEGGDGWGGHTVCASATSMLCAITHDQGGFYVFDATPIIVDEMVPLSEIVESLCLQSNLLISSDLNVTALTQDVRGYRISATAAIRSTLEPLQACWPFDAIQDGYKIKFIPRGGSSVATVSSDDLGAAAPGDKEVVRLSVSREMDTQLPRRIESTFIDYNREYDTGAGPGAERLNTDAVNIRQIELPVVLIVDEAAGIEQTLLYLAWTERQDILFTLPPTFCALQPGDVITVNSTDSSYLVRLSRIQYLPDGRLECSAKYNHAPIYTPAAVGQEGTVTGQTLSYGGPTTLVLLDVPRMNSVQDQPGLLAGTSGVYSGWPGATLLRSDDTGQSWQSIQGFGTPGSLMGYCTSTIGAGSTHVIDTANRLNVRLFSGALASVTALQMFAGANHFAYGAHGRWEIIAGMTVTAEADGTYTLQNLMRGRFGTERYMTTHGATDMLVALDESRLRFIGMNWGSLNLVNQWRAVTRGYMLDSAADVNLAYTGVNFECLSPVVIKGGKNSTGDWTIEWTRRTRTPVEPFSGLNAPLAESSEAYEVEVYSDNTYTTLNRTLTGLTSASATYTSAQQITDFGVVQKYLYVKVYQLSATVGRGYSAIGVVGPTHILNLKSLIHFDEGGVEYLPYRVLGLHCDGTNGSTTFTDIHGKTVTANSGAAISTAQYPSLTGKTSSLLLDGSNDYCSLPDSDDWNFGTGDFTIRFWCRPTSSGSDREIIAHRKDGESHFWFVRHTTAGNVRVVAVAGSTVTDVLSSAALTNNAWNFVEIVRTGGSVKISIGGTFGTTVTTDGTGSWPSTSTSLLYIGVGDNTLIAGNFFAGYLSEIEIVKGMALHTTNFTPPTVPFVDSAGSINLAYRILALHCDGTNGSTTFTDVHGKTVTANGNAQISTAQYPALTGKTSSCYLDGSGDYLSVPTSADFALGTGDFTICGKLRMVSDAAAGGTTLFDFRPSLTAAPFVIYLKNTGTGNFFGIYTSLGTLSMEWDGALALNTWYEFEVVRVSGSWALRLNGSARTFTTGNATSANGDLGSSSNKLTIGIGADGSSSPLNAYISEIEIYKGVAIHTSDYTPSSAPFLDSPLAIIDKAGNTVTVTGTAIVVANAASFGGYCLQANQGSGYVSLPVIDLTMEKWTIDLWVTLDALPSTGNYSGIADYGTAADGNGGFAFVARYDGALRVHFDYYTGITAGSVSAGQRVHLFFMRNGARFYCGANGNVGENRLVADTPFVGNKGFRIGRANMTYTDPKSVKVDEWRIVVNESNYPTSGTYSPPNFPFPDP